MVRMSVVIFPDVNNNSTSHFNMAECSINGCQLSVGIHTSYALSCFGDLCLIEDLNKHVW